VNHRRVDLSADQYDQRWQALAAAGEEIHGEADLVDALLREHGLEGPVLDAGCGTGRVGVELANRGFAVTGIDLDPALLDAARVKDRRPEWVTADLAALGAGTAPGPFAAAVMAGNVMIFVARGTEAAVIGNLASRLAQGGLLIAGFQLNAERLDVAEYDAHCAAAGLDLVVHYATWDREPLRPSPAYVVAVHSKR
jgi:2-polyprenyl-3-methyl-5-hydroxy-6-metoxy-1,4-benzoquinol methylase